MYSSRPKRPCQIGNVARVAPVGHVDVVICQQRAHRVAQQRGEVTGHRRHQQHARLLARLVLGKSQQLRERRVDDHLPRSPRPRARRRPPCRCRMRGAYASAVLGRSVRTRRRRAHSSRCPGYASRADASTWPGCSSSVSADPAAGAQRVEQVRVGLVGLVQHGRSSAASLSGRQRKDRATSLTRKRAHLAWRLRCSRTDAESRGAAVATSKAVLTISSKNYSSWSLRGWLLARFAGLPFDGEGRRAGRSGRARRDAAARLVDPRAEPEGWAGDGVGHAGDRRVPERDRVRRPACCRPTRWRARTAARSAARCTPGLPTCARRCR